jgi:cobalt-zinc-cadmium resistance protein CzcA
VLQIQLNQEQLARHGVPAKVVSDIIESIGGKRLGDVIEGQLRFPLVARLPDDKRNGAEAIGSIMVPTAAGERLPKENLALPPGRYFIEFGGQFEHLQRARTRLMYVVPLAAVLIFGLLYATYQNVVDALRVFTGVPFGWVGGIFALWLRDMPFSISAAIGFIALSGVAVLDDMILVSYVRQLCKKGMPLDAAVMEAATTRLRPVLMTTLVASLGFLPMAFSTGMGAEVQRPLATVVIGGVIGAMVMSLLVLRVLYVLFKSPVTPRATGVEMKETPKLVEVGSY